jgi:hypothetical protein
MSPGDPPPLPVAPEPARAPDSVGRGVLWALMWQLGAIVLSAPLLFTCWGLIQWFALVPVFLNRKRAGYPLMAKGILIAGFVGVLLNGGCAALILGNLGNMH